MFRALQYIILLTTIVMTGFYMNQYQPELVEKLLVKLDFMGFSKVAKDEQDRLASIKKLTIPYEEKQVLMNKNVFMKATTYQATLALGEPKKEIPVLREHSAEVLRKFYVYYLEEDKRPTVLVFDPTDKRDENGEVVFELVNAYKGSAVDYLKISNDTSTASGTNAPAAPVTTAPTQATPVQPPTQR